MHVITVKRKYGNCQRNVRAMWKRWKNADQNYFIGQEAHGVSYGNNIENDDVFNLWIFGCCASKFDTLVRPYYCRRMMKWKDASTDSFSHRKHLSTKTSKESKDLLFPDGRPSIVTRTLSSINFLTQFHDTFTRRRVRVVILERMYLTYRSLLFHLPGDDRKRKREKTFFDASKWDLSTRDKSKDTIGYPPYRTFPS